MRRKIVQIAVAGGSIGPCSDELELDCELYALCNDGSIFYMRDNAEGWLSIRDVPQPTESSPLFDQEKSNG